MNIKTDFQVILGDLLDGIFGAIAEFVGTVLAAIGELFVSACDALLGSDRLVIVIPSGLATAVLFGFGIRALTGGGTGALISIATLIIIGVLFVFFLLAILLAVVRRKKRS